MYTKTLFLIDRGATVGGLAGGFNDLASLAAADIHTQRVPVPAHTLALAQIAEMGRASEASLVAVGVSDPAALYETGIEGRAALPDHPLLYLGVNAPSGPLIPQHARILSHVLAPSDYSVRSGCMTSCLIRVAKRGAKIVTLMHVPSAVDSCDSADPQAGELGRVDTDWIDQLKKLLFSAGVDEVRFISPMGSSPEFDQMSPHVSLVLVGATCSSEIANEYVKAAGRLVARHKDVPALMLTAESCVIADPACDAA